MLCAPYFEHHAMHAPLDIAHDSLEAAVVKLQRRPSNGLTSLSELDAVAVPSKIIIRSHGVLAHKSHDLSPLTDHRSSIMSSS